jgi:hypothetical protein
VAARRRESTRSTDRAQAVRPVLIIDVALGAVAEA